MEVVDQSWTRIAILTFSPSRADREEVNAAQWLPERSNAEKWHDYGVLGPDP